VIEGLGIEIVEVQRLNAALKRWGAPLYRRLFTSEELEYCLTKHDPGPHLAARFAAKISFFKATGRALPFCSLGVRRDERGKPFIVVSGGSDESFCSSLTITHTRETAVAAVLVEKLL